MIGQLDIFGGNLSFDLLGKWILSNRFKILTVESCIPLYRSVPFRLSKERPKALEVAPLSTLEDPKVTL